MGESVWAQHEKKSTQLICLLSTGAFVSSPSKSGADLRSRAPPQLELKTTSCLFCFVPINRLRQQRAAGHFRRRWRMFCELRGRELHSPRELLHNSTQLANSNYAS